MTSKEQIEDYMREMLANRLSQCSQVQRDLFAKIFPGEVPASKLEQCIDLCDRTIAKNLKDPARLAEQKNEVSHE
jgi:3-methyladenine DNA glycosylase AlkC